MNVLDAANELELGVVCCNDNPDIQSVFCCDLLSVAMARAPADSAWITVIGNVNAVAVASLADVACIVLAEGFDYDAAAVEAAREKCISLLRSNLPIYETAAAIGGLL